MNWYSYTPVYVRAGGNDTNNGLSVFNAVATVQHAYDLAAAMSGNVVIDLDSGTYAGITLTADWPIRIGVRGVSAILSSVGGINGNGMDDDYMGTGNYSDDATSGFNITIVSDQSCNLGPVSANSGAGMTTTGDNPHGGSINLLGCVANKISASGTGVGNYNGNPGGSIVLNYTDCWDVKATAGSYFFAQGGPGGNISISNSLCGNLDSSAGDAGMYGGSSGGTITTTNSVCGNIKAVGTCGGGDFAGNGGNLVLAETVFGVVHNEGGGVPGDFGNGIAGVSGSISLTNCTLSYMPSWLSTATVTGINTFALTEADLMAVIMPALTPIIQDSKVTLPFTDILGSSLF